MKQKYIPFNVIEDFINKILIKAGVPANDAKIVGDVLINADKYGFDSHGVNRLKPIYLDRVKDDILNTITNFEIVRESPTTAVIDGHNGLGHVVGYNSMKMAIDKAKTYGMGMVAVRNSTHYGFAGYYALMAIKEDMIGITGTNARPSIAPTFGIENMLGTNPMTFGIPTDEKFPFLLDCATSITQRGKIELYAREDKMMPEGWVIDESGNPVTDPNEALDKISSDKAVLTPLGGTGEETGGYKGYGYATVVEILSAALQQGAFLRMLLGKENGRKIPYPLGHFFIAINISAFTEPSDFKKTAGDILRELRASKKMPGQNRIFTAGEKEYEILMERKDKGVPFNEQLLQEYRELCVSYNLQEFLHYFE